MVQLAQVRQRPATSSHRGSFGLACRHSFMPLVSSTVHLPHDLKRSGDHIRRRGRKDGGAPRNVPRPRRCRFRPKPCSSPSINSVRRDQIPVGLRPRLHRNAKAGAAGHAAIHRDDEIILASRAILRVGIIAVQQNPVLDGDRVNFARTHAKKGEFRDWLFRIDNREIRRRRAAPAIVFDRRVEKALPGLRPDRVTEQRPVITPGER